jgi:DNA polymerase III epsilon subunit-like protein
MNLPVHERIPEGLNHRTGLKNQGLVPVGQPVAEYRYRTRKGYLTCDLYDVTQVRPVDPMRVAAGLQATETRKLAEKARRQAACAQAEQDALKIYQHAVDRAVKRFRFWYDDPQTGYLDTETTGLSGQVIEVALVDRHGHMQFHSLVRPTIPVEPEAQAVLNLSDAELADAPSWTEVAQQLRPWLDGRRIVAFNADFDQARLKTSDEAHGLVPQDNPPIWRCAMDAYGPLHGDWSDYHGDWRWASLLGACRQMGVPPEAATHRAIGGAQALARLVTAVAERDWAARTLADLPKDFVEWPE